MGRGAEKETRRAVDTQLAQQNAMNQQIFGENQALRSTVVPAYQQMLAQPGYSEAEKTAITGQTMGALGSVFDALANRAANRVARTRNTAGYGELLDELGREQGREAAGLSQQNQIAFANRALSDRLTALGGLGGLYGVDTSLLGRALGIPADLLNVRARASGGSDFRFGFGPAGISFGLSG